MEQKEVMMVISELDFRKYLDHQTDPISTAACALFPRPTSLAQHYHHGDFDVLIIHRHYGLIVGEVKSVGADLENTQDLAEAVVKRVKKAAGQLNKAEGVLSHLVSDMAPVRVTKTLILPNITSAQLLQALGMDAAVKEVRTVTHRHRQTHTCTHITHTHTHTCINITHKCTHTYTHMHTH